MSIADAIADAISRATGQSFRHNSERQLGDGCINQAFRLSDGQRRFFVKLNDCHFAGMFEAEAAGLAELESAQTLRVPHPVVWGNAGNHSFLVLEYLDLASNGNAEEMGRRLAQLHRKTSSQFGWNRDNTIGSTPQHNPWTDGWIEFLRESRFGFQLDLARRNSLSTKMIDATERLLGHLDVFFTGYSPAPSLLHGDLWGGNAAYSLSGEPVVFDPAIYYGDREADLAMTELFGGFNSRFYDAYCEAWAPDAGYKTRKNLYNLYHVLNHAYMFGGSYVRQAETMAQHLLAELK